jgi:hypothetical protein
MIEFRDSVPFTTIIVQYKHKHKHKHKHGYSTVQNRTAQNSSAQHSTAQHSTAQHSTVQTSYRPCPLFVIRRCSPPPAFVVSFNGIYRIFLFLLLALVTDRTDQGRVLAKRHVQPDRSGLDWTGPYWTGRNCTLPDLCTYPSSAPREPPPLSILSLYHLPARQ